MGRPSWDSWGLGIAEAVSTRGDCKRRQVGSVILDKDHRIAAAGYNGSYPSGPSCLAGECPRGSSDVPPGSSYDSGPGQCHALHSEINSLLYSSLERNQGGTIYVTDEPCTGCWKIIKGSGLSRAV